MFLGQWLSVFYILCIMCVDDVCVFVGPPWHGAAGQKMDSFMEITVSFHFSVGSETQTPDSIRLL